eukprot:8242525-Pyramimonas_sp.AAC.1
MNNLSDGAAATILLCEEASVAQFLGTDRELLRTRTIALDLVLGGSKSIKAYTTFRALVMAGGFTIRVRGGDRRGR